jgi:hypothetical protein
VWWYLLANDCHSWPRSSNWSPPRKLIRQKQERLNPNRTLITVGSKRGAFHFASPSPSLCGGTIPPRGRVTANETDPGRPVCREVYREGEQIIVKTPVRFRRRNEQLRSRLSS